MPFLKISFATVFASKQQDVSLYEALLLKVFQRHIQKNHSGNAIK